MKDSTRNPYVVSLLFDRKLIEMGKWPEDICSKIEEWNETDDYEMQKTKAAFLISHLILEILGKDCGSRGKIRAKRLGKALADLEQITISTHGLARKYYRDHLNHIIRVALLARAIGQKVPFSLPHQDLSKLVLASLFHDVAYPLFNISRSARRSIKAIKDCYNIASGASLIPKIRFSLDKETFSFLPPEIFRRSEINLEELDHGILSSLEFISYLDQDASLLRKYQQVIRAVALHIPSDIREINSKREKVLSVLILADELQDWGRPTGHLTQLSFIPKIQRFKLENHLLRGEYNTRNIIGFSTLKQIHGKRQNLTRVRLPKQFDFCLKFSFDNFDKISLRGIEDILQTLFQKCLELEGSLFDPSHFETLYKNDSIFENEYYGKSIPRKTKLQLFELLRVNELSAHSPFRNMHVFFNDSIKELLATDTDVDKIEHFQFRSSSSGLINLEMVSQSNGAYKGEIKSINDHEVLDLAMFLLSETRFLNICVQKIAKFQNGEYPVKLGFEGFPRKKDMVEVAKKTKETKIHEYCRLLIRLRDCVLNEGFFSFSVM